MKDTRLIAEFMGYKIEAENEIGVLPLDNGGVLVTDFREINYRNDWNFLMEVVDKIESIVFDDYNFYNVTVGSSYYCSIQDRRGDTLEIYIDGEESKIQCVYRAVVEFIKKYNERNKPLTSEQIVDKMFKNLKEYEDYLRALAESYLNNNEGLQQTFKEMIKKTENSNKI